jgi:hypothetical protein
MSGGTAVEAAYFACKKSGGTLSSAFSTQFNSTQEHRTVADTTQKVLESNLG